MFKIDEGKNPDAVIDQMNGLKDEAQYGLSVSATSLIQIMAATEDGEIKGERALKMLKIIDKGRAIVVYRCSPGQKAQITQIVKDNMKEAITLAIGDGANDVNMIQQAHIGVGVFGKEGNQAACFSDYAIPQFKVLRRLLLWHGRSFGVRFSNFVKWFLYKNINTSFFAFWFNL